MCASVLVYATAMGGCLLYLHQLYMQCVIYCMSLDASEFWSPAADTAAKSKLEIGICVPVCVCIYVCACSKWVCELAAESSCRCVKLTVECGR